MSLIHIVPLLSFVHCIISHRHLCSFFINVTSHLHLVISSRLTLYPHSAAFEYAMQWMGEEVDLDEIECILANLIFQGKIKGYLSHQKRFLVVSKADPFPMSAVIKKPSF